MYLKHYFIFQLIKYKMIMFYFRLIKFIDLKNNFLINSLSNSKESYDHKVNHKPV